MAKKKVLVCGVTGFIGRNIAEVLAADGRYDVVGSYFRRDPFNTPGISFVRADLTNREQTDALVSEADIIIQAAAVTSGVNDVVNRPHIHISDNAVMNSHILQAANTYQVKHLVFFSCSIMYPSSPVPLREEDFDAGKAMAEDYFGAGWTKVYIEKMCEFYSRIGDTRFTVIRHSNVYGPHDKFDLESSHVFGATLTKVMTAEDGQITVWGTGEEKRDLLYVSDLVAFVETALERQKEPFGLYNVGGNICISVNELVAAIIAGAKRNLKIVHDESKPTIQTSVGLDCSKAEQALGWAPKVSLETGIEYTLEWFRENCC